ncbi:DUF4838 domain-containing protein [Runella sp.]|uniref:DUF4838 domain-containing protein n=1 Tax=Runella sp. TaxID=1960881 RepID=UPI003D121E04
MKNLFLLIFLSTLLFTENTHAQKLSPQPIATGQWLKTWLLCGPFPLETPKDAFQQWDHLVGFNKDYLTKIGGEKNPQFQAGDVVKYATGTAKWVLHTTPDSIIDLNKTVSRNDNVIAYAYTEVMAAEAGVWFVSLGTNDGGRLWVNGVEVWDVPEARGLTVDDDVIPVTLKKGTNTLLLKVEERGNRWEFCVRLFPFSTQKLVEKGGIFKITTKENGEAELVSELSTTVLNELVKKVHYSISNSQKKAVTSDERSKDFCQKLNIKTDNLQPYVAQLTIILKSGEQINQSIRFEAGKRMNYSLFSNQKSTYRIALAANASGSEQWAAQELQRWLKEISGVELPIQSLNQAYDGPQIVVGFNEFVTAKTGATQPAVTDESFRYCNAGQDILIYGGSQRGTMYGVMTFLENELGCRFYTPTVQMIPKRDELIFNHFDHAESPGVRVRNDFYYEAFDPTWAARNKMNGAMNERKQPGGVEAYWSVHTFYPLIPPAEFFGKHPEYYSLIEGKRTHDRAQLCLSNPEVLQIMIERIKKRMRESPDNLIYDVSQNDWYNPCQCDKCRAIVQREGGESGINIWFVNQVAEAVEKEFPSKFIGTLAYQYTRTPPKSIRPRNNVVVRLCSIECCFAHDFKSCPENQSFLQDLKGWSTLAPHMYIWDYVVNFSHYIMPYPNFKVLQPNIKTFQENNAIGIMEQAAYQSRGGEFAELKAYLISKLLWNPDCDVNEVVDDFMYGYYGRAGKFIRQYYDLIQGQITPNTHIHLGLKPDDPIFAGDFVQQASKLFKEAEKVADNVEMLRRVEMASLPLLYLKCRKNPTFSRVDGTYLKFNTIVKREGITHFAEEGAPNVNGFHSWVENAK